MSKRFKHFMQTIAVTVLIFMLPQILCINCFAVGVGNTQSAEIMADDVDNVLEAEKTEAEILCEVEEMRTENTKYFMLSNGSYIAAQYTTPVHYEENGEWLEIDNAIQKSETGYTAEKTSTPVSFPDKLNDEENVSVEIDGYELEFKPLDTQAEGDKSNGKVDKAENLASNKIAKKNGKITAYDNSNKNEKLKAKNKKGAISYDAVYESIDIEYELSSTQLKESIVLNKKQGKTSFSFEMDFDGLVPVLEDDGTVVLYSDREHKDAVSEIAAPYMFDSAGAESKDIKVSIKEKDGKFIYTLKPNKSWLNEKDREYPVVIDPTIKLDVDRNDTVECYVDNSSPNTPFPFDEYLYTGNGSLGKTRTFVKFALPELPDDNCIITSAAVYFVQNSLDNGNGTTAYMSIHEVTEDWNNSTLKPTWNDQPSYDSMAIDYNKYDPDFSHNYIFDITRVAKKWYENETYDSNYGLMLRSVDESIIKRTQLFSAENDLVDAYPFVCVAFRNNKGLESYWSYSSYSIDTAGSAHINDYTGNLVYEMPILSSISEIMPLTLVGYYNNYCAGVELTAGKSSSSRTSIGKGFRLNVQQTVLPSSQYGLDSEAQKTYPYVYTDADGTEHYIQKETKDGKTTYKDEDGLDLELKLPTDISGVKYTISDKQDNVLYFNSKGNLCKQKDANGNTIEISFKAANGSALEANSRISQIKDGAGHTFTFTYYVSSAGVEQNYVKKITDNAGRVITFTTTSSADGLAGLLTKVTYSDGTHLDIKYVDNGEGLIDEVQANDGYALNFDYSSKKTGRKIITVKEYGRNESGANVAGQRVTFDRTKYNTTVIRSAGLDGIHNSQSSSNGNDDIVTILQFDDGGRTTSQQVAYGSGAEIGAGSYSYTTKTDDKTTLGSKNKVNSSASLGKNVINLLYGGNAETTSGWTTGSSSTITTAKGVDSNNKYMGLKSLKINNSAFTGTGVSYYRQDITDITAGNDYTMSAYVKTSALTEKYDSNLKGAYIQMTAFNSAGTNLLTVYSERLTESTDTAINKGWRRLTTTIDLPADTVKLTVYLCFENMTGTAYFDCIQVESGTTANSYNMLENSSFEKSSSGLPAKWTAIDVQYTTNSSGAVLDGLTTVQKKLGTYSLRIEGKEGLAKGYGQEIAVEGNPDDTYIVSGWAKSYAVNPTYHEETKFEIAIKIYYECKDNATGETETVTQYKDAAKFNSTINDWQYASSPFVLKYKNGESGKTYTPVKIKVVPRFVSQSNQVYFDHVQLIKDVASSYIYDSEGNVVSVAANAEQKNDMTYDGKDLKTYKDAAGYETKYNYDSKHNLTSIQSAKGVKTENTYASNGNLTSAEVKNSNASAIIKTGKEYHSANSEKGIKEGAYLRKDFDENGYETYYQSAWVTGLPVSVTDANGVKTSYSYTDKYQLQTVTTGISKVKYMYKTLSNILSSLVFSGTSSDSPSETYSFTYDSYGNRKTTSVGNKVLSTNNYAANNGALQSITYGNGDTVSYSYNNLGQVSYEYKNSDELSYHWIYNADGTPLIHRDYENALKYEYSYDAIDRLIRQEITTNEHNNATHIGYTEFGYDKRNNLTKIINEIDGRKTSQTYSYSTVDQSAQSVNYTKDNLPTLYKAFSTRYATYDYDSLNRLNLRTFSTTKPLYNNYLYTTSGRNANGSSNYRTTQLRTEIIADTAYRYTYDKVGNITKIEKGTRTNAGTSGTDVSGYTVYYSYQYDNLNQLKKISDSAGVQTDITYDEIGNILRQHSHLDNTTIKDIQYIYTADTDSDGNGTAEAGWNNLLTAIQITDENGTTVTQTIDYDQIGNPTTYRGANLVFNGRELESYTKGSNTISYTYDADGVRGTKTVNGVKSTYQYINGMLVYEKRGSAQLYFYYDSYDHLSAISYYPDCTSDTNYTYYALTNTQGDVLGFYNSAGVLRASYEYDAWGNATIVDNTGINIGTVNPIRYRGYYYDEETGLYYLQSRYYDPEIGRFISADAPETLDADFENLTQYNLFVYCFNNPVKHSDEIGAWPSWATKLAIGVGVIAVGALVVASTAATGGAAAAFVGAAVAGLKTAAVSGAIAAGTNAAVTAVTSIASGNNAKTTIKNTASAAVNGFANGFMWGGINFGVSRFTGYVTSKTGIFSRNVKYGKNNFMYGTNELTIWRHGPNFRIDASATRGLHYHLRTATIGIGVHRTKWIQEIIGGVVGLLSAAIDILGGIS